MSTSPILPQSTRKPRTPPRSKRIHLSKGIDRTFPKLFLPLQDDVPPSTPGPGPGGVGASDGAVHQQVDDEVNEVVSRELRRRGRGRTRVPEAEAALVGALDVARELGRDLCANQICNPNSM